MKVIFLCSGKGSRMKPLSEKYPKSLIPVHCDSLVRLPNLFNSIRTIQSSQFFKKNVTEILIVAGPSYFERNDYLSHKKAYDSLLSKTPIKEIINEDTEYNNNFSLLLTLSEESSFDDYLIVEGDVAISSDFINILDSCELKKTTYFCQYRENEWCFVSQEGTDPPTVIKNCNGMAMSGVSFLTSKDAKMIYDRLFSLSHESRLIEFWEDSLIDLRLKVNVINAGGTLKEFDTIPDLVSQRLLTAQEVADLLDDEGCSEKTSSMTNTSFIVRINGVKKVLRIPGKGTEKYIDRVKESVIQHRINDYEYYVSGEEPLSAPAEIYEEGVKLSEFLNSYQVSQDDFDKVICTLNKLHQYNEFSVTSRTLIDLVREVSCYESSYNSEHVPENYLKVKEAYLSIIKPCQHDHLVLCHRDLDLRNILVNEDTGDCKLIDFEYSGYLNKYWDFSAYLSELKLVGEAPSEKSFSLLAKSYGVDLDPNELLKWRGIVDFIWSCWTIAKLSVGENYQDYFNERWKSACDVLKVITTLS